jgi:hypothetical protein
MLLAAQKRGDQNVQIELTKTVPIADWAVTFASVDLTYQEGGRARTATVFQATLPARALREEAAADAQLVDALRTDFEVQLDRGWHVEKCEDRQAWWCPEALAVVLKDRFANLLDDVQFEAAMDCVYQHDHPAGLLTKAAARCDDIDY